METPSIKTSSIRLEKVSKRISERSQPGSGSFKSEILVDVLKSSEKNIFQFRIQNQILTGKSYFRFFAGEKIQLEKSPWDKTEWKILSRRFTPLQNTERESYEELRIGKDQLFKRQSANDIIKSYLRQDSEILNMKDTSLWKNLENYFPFMDWIPESQFFEWIWDDAKANAYFSPSNKGKSFLIDYESSFAGKCKFLFIVETDELEWNFFATMENWEFYEIFLQYSNDLKSDMKKSWKGLKHFEIEYNSSSNETKNKGWVA